VAEQAQEGGFPEEARIVKQPHLLANPDLSRQRRDVGRSPVIDPNTSTNRACWRQPMGTIAGYCVHLPTLPLLPLHIDPHAHIRQVVSINFAMVSIGARETKGSVAHTMVTSAVYSLCCSVIQMTPEREASVVVATRRAQCAGAARWKLTAKELALQQLYNHGSLDSIDQ
jgi:hypothetical protein